MSDRPLFTETLPGRKFDLGQAVAFAAGARGVSRLRILADMLRRQFGRQKLTAYDYFLYGVHLPALTAAERDAFLGEAAFQALNRALNGTGDLALTGLFKDKLLTQMVLERAGLPVPAMRAAAAPRGAPGPWPVVQGAAALAGLLAGDLPLPAFGKPVHSTRSIGVLRIDGRDAGGMLRLGDGRTAPAAEVAARIVAAFPQGYLFQECLVPHPDMAALTGPAIAALRVCSLWDDAVARPLYAAMRLPAPGAVADDAGAGFHSLAVVDLDTGRIRRAQDGRRLGGNDLAVSPVTGAPLAGAALPDFAAALDLAARVHAVFPGHRLMGIDIALTDRGPVVAEINGNPMHSLYQRAGIRGILNPEIAPHLRRALAQAGITGKVRGLPLP